MIPDIRRVQSELESAMLEAVDKAAGDVAGMSTDAAASNLTALTDTLTTRATREYKALGDFLFVKFLDGNIKRQNPDGSFARTPEGTPVQPEFGGYNEAYFRTIAESPDGERLKVRKIEQ